MPHRAHTIHPGSFGYVVLARNNDTDEVVAVKIIKRSDASKYVTGEILNHSQLRHPHVVQFKEVSLFCCGVDWRSWFSCF